MKTNNIIYNRQVLLLSIALLISSCVTFKPDFYDSETKTYNNYKSNYSVKILDDFEFTLKDSVKDPISKKFVYALPLGAKVVYNKQYPIFIAFFEYTQMSAKYHQYYIQSRNDSTVMNELKERFIKIFNKYKIEIDDFKIEDINGFVTFDYVMTSKLVDINQNISFTSFLVEQKSPKANFFVVTFLCFPSHEPIAKEKYIEFLNGIQFHSFTEEERRK